MINFWSGVMKKIPEAIYKSPEEIEALAKEREAEAVLLRLAKCVSPL
jgi:hypothetical protein